MALPIATKGTPRNTRGLRGHTVGATYPYSVIAVGHAPTLWGAFDTRTGVTGTLWPSAQQAQLDAQLFKLVEGL